MRFTASASGPIKTNEGGPGGELDALDASHNPAALEPRERQPAALVAGATVRGDALRSCRRPH
jgi:hypothetical protein